MASIASAQYTETFESYAASAAGTVFTSGPANSGGWEQWDGAANSQTLCYGSGASVAAHGGSQYIGTQLLSDTIKTFSTFSAGHWNVSIWTYVPQATGSLMQDDQWAVYLNEYNHFGPYEWATQVVFDPALGEVRADNGYSLVTNTPQYGVGTTLTFDAWKELSIDVNVSADVATVSYDGQQLGDPFTWSLGPFGNNVGVVANIACIDLYANSTTLTGFMYWDDVTITDASGPPAPTTYCTVGTTAGACNPTIGFSGTASASASSGFTLSASNLDTNRSGLFFYAITDTNFVPSQWGSGGTSYLCVKAPTQRMTVQNTGGTTGCTGAASQDWNAFMAANSGALGNPRTAGASFDAQFWMRDPPSPKSTILTNALRFILAP
jgi:hypothetical protein